MSSMSKKGRKTLRRQKEGIIGMKYTVTAVWDSEAKVWVATSEDVPGLVIEADTIEHLFKELTVLVPELLEANGALPGGNVSEIPIHLMSERLEHIPLRS